MCVRPSIVVHRAAGDFEGGIVDLANVVGRRAGAVHHPVAQARHVDRRERVERAEVDAIGWTAVAAGDVERVALVVELIVGRASERICASVKPEVGSSSERCQLCLVARSSTQTSRF